MHGLTRTSSGPLPAAWGAQSREASKEQHGLKMLQDSALTVLLLAFNDLVTPRAILEIYFFSLCTYLMFSIYILFCERPEESP